MRATTGSKLPDDQPFLCTGRGVKGERSESEGHERVPLTLRPVHRSFAVGKSRPGKGRWPDE